MTVEEPQMGLTFEQVWATIQRIAEKHEETERTITKMNRELNQAIGNLGNRLGEPVEHLVSPNLLKKFNAFGYAFGKSCLRLKYMYWDRSKI